MEAFSSAVVDKFHYRRRSVVSGVCIAGFLGSIIFTAKSGLFWVDIVDHFVTHYGLVIVAIIQCILVGWIYKAVKMRKHIEHAGDIKVTQLWDISVRYITPAVLFILLVQDLFKEVSQPYEGYPWSALIGIGNVWLLVTLISGFLIAIRPWRRELKDEDHPH